jgi:RNA polymerase sigma-70 factor (ECF subfamily)
MFRVRGGCDLTPQSPEPSKLDAGGSVNVSYAVARNNRTGIGHHVSVITQTDRPVASERFEDVVLPHLDAAYRLARWLIRNEHDAEDIVQEASLRALRYFQTFAGRNGRAWFLRIVRNTCWSWRAQTARTATDIFDEDQHKGAQLTCDPETLLLHAADASLIDETLRNLPDRYRELLVLRELEGLSYQELADVLEIPIGTVMSGLSRARQAFRRALETRLKGIEHAMEMRSC